ncbi:MAG: Dabb family protein [Candidatus Hydrogenedentales bacterium]
MKAIVVQRRAVAALVALALTVLLSTGCLVVRGKVSTSTSVHSGEDRVLQHIVLFNFNDTATAVDIAAVERAFRNLPHQIPSVQDFSWGVEMSGRNLNKGFTHGGVFTFASEADRDAYSAHPSHVAFAKLVGPYVEELFVFDYWAQE